MSDSRPPVIAPKKTEPAQQPTDEKGPKDRAKDAFFEHSDIDLIPVKQYFGIDAADTVQDKHVRVILDWAKGKGLSDRSALNTELRKLELKLGAPELGERRTVRVARYLELDRRLEATIREMSSFDKDR